MSAKQQKTRRAKGPLAPCVVSDEAMLVRAMVGETEAVHRAAQWNRKRKRKPRDSAPARPGIMRRFRSVIRLRTCAMMCVAFYAVLLVALALYVGSIPESVTQPVQKVRAFYADVVTQRLPFVFRRMLGT